MQIRKVNLGHASKKASFLSEAISRVTEAYRINVEEMDTKERKAAY